MNESNEMELTLGSSSKVEKSDAKEKTPEEEAKKILGDALAKEMQERLKKENIKNAKGKNFLETELFYLGLMAGERIVDESQNHVASMLRMGMMDQKRGLPGNYLSEIETEILGLPLEEIDKMVLKITVFECVDKEIVKLKKSDIYQGRIRDIDSLTPWILTEKIIGDIRFNAIENDFLSERESNHAKGLKIDYVNEIERFAHETVLDELVVDEVPISLNINNVSGNEDIEIETKNDIGNIAESGETIEIGEILKECEENLEKLQEKYLEMEIHCTTDDEMMDAIQFYYGQCKPLLDEYEKIYKQIGEAGIDQAQLASNLSELNKKFVEEIKKAEDILQKHNVVVGENHSEQETETPDGEMETEQMNEREIFEKTLELVDKFKQKIIERLSGHQEWEEMGEYHQGTFVEDRVISFLDKLIKQEKMVLPEEEDDFIKKVLLEAFGKIFL